MADCGGERMRELALLLKILQGLNATTPTIIGAIDMIRRGRDEGKTDDEIQAESMSLALDTRAQTERDMGEQP